MNVKYGKDTEQAIKTDFDEMTRNGVAL